MLCNRCAKWKLQGVFVMRAEFLPYWYLNQKWDLISSVNHLLAPIQAKIFVRNNKHLKNIFIEARQIFRLTRYVEL